MFAEHILQKKGLRSDRIWTLSPLYNSKILRSIPFYLDTWALLRSQFWPRDRLKKLQDVRSAAVLRHASTLPFWKEIFQHANVDTTQSMELETLRKIPVTSKSNFTDRDPTTFTVQGLSHQSIKDYTSGSTGRPFLFYHDRGFFLRSFGICERMFRTAGKGARYPIVTMRPRDRMGFAFRGYHFFYLRGFTSVEFRIEQLLELLQSLRGVAILFTFSSTMLELAQLVRARDARLPVRGLLVAGEDLSPARRKEIEKLTGAEVWMYYSMGELGRLAFECEKHALHINEEWAYIEIVDSAGISLPDGKPGRIVATGFDTTVMPFIRYQTGDWGCINATLCPCGRTLRTLTLEGREMHLIKFPDGRTISLLGISGTFDQTNKTVKQFQLIRITDYMFRIRVVPGSAFQSSKDNLRDSVIRCLHPQAQIEWEEVDTIEPGPNGKARYYIDSRI